MYNRQLKLAALIFLGLVVVLSLKLFLPKLLPEKSAYTDKLDGLTKTSVQKISITKDNESVELTKESNGWRLDGKRANKAKIEGMLDQLMPKTDPVLVAETSQKHKDYGVDKESATVVKLNDKTALLIGLTSSDSGIYVRFEGDDKVFAVKEASSYRPTAKKTDWYDKGVLSTEKDKIQKVSGTVDGKQLSVTKKNDKWVDANDKEVSQDKMNSLLSNLATLTAQDLADDANRRVYPTTPQFSLTVDYDGQTETLDFFPGTDNYWVERRVSREKFIVSIADINNLLNATRDLQL